MHISSLGQWNSDSTVNNRITRTPTYFENNTLAVSDGAGGSIIVFADLSKSLIRAKKVDADGKVSWGTLGSPLMVADSTSTFSFDALPDGHGGVFIAWNKWRLNFGRNDVYIQHLDSSGNKLWGGYGIQANAGTSNYNFSILLCSDANGGVILSWSWDNRTSDAQQMVQRYNSAGVPQWAVGGLLACTATGFRAGVAIVGDGASGVILYFTDSRDDAQGLVYTDVYISQLTNLNIYAQRIDANGNRLWTDAGKPVCLAPGNQFYDVDVYHNAAIADGYGNTILVFNDYRNDLLAPQNGPTNIDMYAQKLDGNGNPLWTASGVPITTAPGNQLNILITSDRIGGCVTSWTDDDTELIFTQRTDGNGVNRWGANGVNITSFNCDYSYNGSLINDSAGYFFYAYTNYFNDVPTLLVQKLDTTGLPKFGPGGKVVSTREVLDEITMVPNNNGFILVWRALSNGNGEVYASNLLSGGILAGVASPGFVSIANGNWNNPSTWVGNLVPTSNAQVTVRHQVNVTTNTICNSLYVEPLGGNVLVKAGANLNVKQ